ncbi:EAL domain-containing protein [Hydrogenimonas sp.]
MHRVLKRILKKSRLSPEEAPDAAKWRQFLEKVDETFVSNDEDRYLLERSLDISSKEMEELLEASKESYQQRIATLIKAIPDLIFYVDEEGRFLDVLSQGRELLYLPKEEVTGKTIEKIFPEEQAKVFLDAIHRALSTGKLQVETYTLMVEKGRSFFEARIMPSNMSEKGKRTTLCIVRDMTAEKRSIEYLNVIKKIFEDATEGILIASVDGERIDVNDAFCRMFDISPEEVPGFRPSDYWEFLKEGTMEEIEEALKAKGSFHGEVTIQRRDGEELLAWLTLDTVYNESGEATHQVAMLTDISELEASRKKLHFTATHDTLTKLPNRMLLFEKLGEALKKSHRKGASGALFFIDLDNFKEINDTAGHKAGDKVLQECSQRITSVLRETDTFGRLGGDEFLLIIEEIDNVDAPMHVAKKIIDQINRPFHIGEEIFELGASIGIALFPEDSIDAEELIQFADMAMYRAKEKGKNRFQYYSRSLDNSIRRHYMIERALKDALRHASFYLLYQPQVQIATGKITGVEALLRVDESIIGLISPGEFIPIAEESDLILKIGHWVFDEACRQIAAWRKEGVENLLVAINLSRRQLMDEGWTDFVRETIDHYGVDPANIELEITETTFMHSRQSGYKTIKKLQQRGFRFSIDDFGTGYSSLANLKHFTVDKLKIDRSFIDDIITNEFDRAIVHASVALAHALGLTVIAEGVEHEEQKKMLLDMGCDELQGYLFSHPVPASRIPTLLKSTSSAT